MLFTISRALTVGRGATVMTVLGNATGVFVQVVRTAFGMDALVERSAPLAAAAADPGGAVPDVRVGAGQRAFAAGSAREWFARSPRRIAAIGGVGGLVMIGVGVDVAVTGRKN